MNISVPDVLPLSDAFCQTLSRNIDVVELAWLIRSPPIADAEWAYSQLDNLSGRNAAWEQPQLISEEVRAGFRPLRK